MFGLAPVSLLDVYFRNKAFFPLIKEALGTAGTTGRMICDTRGRACT